eukprot:7208594-Alexandrium_andersonii.AAC.1
MRALRPRTPGPCQQHRVPSSASGLAGGGGRGSGGSGPGAGAVGLVCGAPHPGRPPAGSGRR